MKHFSIPRCSSACFKRLLHRVSKIESCIGETVEVLYNCLFFVLNGHSYACWYNLVAIKLQNDMLVKLNVEVLNNINSFSSSFSMYVLTAVKSSTSVAEDKLLFTNTAHTAQFTSDEWGKQGLWNQGLSAHPHRLHPPHTHTHMALVHLEPKHCREGEKCVWLKSLFFISLS